MCHRTIAPGAPTQGAPTLTLTLTLTLNLKHASQRSPQHEPMSPHISLALRKRSHDDALPFCGHQAEVTSFTFAEACAQPSAKHLEFHGSDGPVHVVEVDGTFFIQNDEAEAKAARSKALELAPEVAVASKAAANPAAAEEEVAAAPTPMPEPAAAHRISYAAVASKSVGPKPSAAGFEPRAVAPSKFSAGPKCSTPAPKPAVVPAPLEV